MKNRYLITVLAAITVIAASGCSKRAADQPTALTDFSAPFVFGRFEIPVDNQLSVEAVELGRRLFYDVRLSGNNQIACATCHIQSLAFTDGKARAVGISGKVLAFSSMSLVNLLWGPQLFFWNGRSSSIEDQALKPIQDENEMGQDLSELVIELKDDDHYEMLFAKAYGEINSENIARALASFQRTLVSSNSRYDKFLRGEVTLSKKEELGRKLFVAHPDAKASLRGGNCIDCHSQFLTGGFKTAFDGFSNNGLDTDENLPPGLYEVTGNASHRGLFKVPTLRNIAVTAPYMHDGRFGTLEEVLDHYNEGIRKSETLSPLIVEADNIEKGVEQDISLNLSAVEKDAIIAFLHTLTDQEFLNNEKFSDPFR